MIGIIDIIRAYSGLIETVLGAPPVTKDVTEGEDRPYSYLQPDECTRTKEGLLIHDTVTLELYWFAPDTARGYIDLLEKRELLTLALLEPVEVAEGFHVCPDSVYADFQRDDMVLTCRWTVETMQEPDPDEDPGELMEILEYEMREE